MYERKKFRMVAALLLAGVIATACGEANSSGGGASGLTGDIAIDGSSTVFPIAQAVAEDFQIENPDVKVAVGFAGTGGGFESFCAGETQISNASRVIEEDEEACLEDAGIEYTEFQVGVDGLAVVTRPDTEWTDCVTFDQLHEIFKPSSEVSSWSEVDPSWPDRPVELFSPDPDSGTYDYFAEVVSDPDADDPAVRDDLTQSADDNVLVQGVLGTEGSLGYFGFAYFQENADSIKALEVDDGTSGCVAPTSESVLANEYPLSRPLFFYVANDALEDETVAAYVSFWVTQAAEFAEAVGYVAPPEDVTADNADKLGALIE